LKNNTLICCLDVLKIEKDSEVYRNALELAQKAPIEKNSNEGTIAMKIIAHVNVPALPYSE
jgi:hypothetical protein